MTPFDNLKLPQRGGSVPTTRFVEVDNTAIASGMWTSGLTGISAILATPENASVWMWLIGLVITGLFGVASSAIAVLLKYRLDVWRARRIADTEKRD